MRVVLGLCVLALAGPAHATDAGVPADAGWVPTRAAGGEQVIDFSDEEAMGAGEMVVGEDPTPVEHDTLMPERYQRGLDQHPGEVEDRGCAGCSSRRPENLWVVWAALAAVWVRRRVELARICQGRPPQRT
jgi:hypothetical protein